MSSVHLVLVLLAILAIPTQQEKACVDDITNCYEFKHVCERSPYIKKMCSKTCGVCNTVTAMDDGENQILADEVQLFPDDTGEESGLQHFLDESKQDQNLEEQHPSGRGRRNNLCRRKLGGRCVKRRKPCPGRFNSQTNPGRPYCSKSRRCCHQVSEECRDTSSNCDRFAHKCSTDMYVQERCKRTCNLCKNGSKPDACIDTSSNCDRFAHMCSTDMYVQERCKRTCNLCKNGSKPVKHQIWWDLGQNELKAALNLRKNEGTAKNIVLFLGDGMGITASTAGRIYKGQLKGSHGEEGYLAWERFPNMGLLKTYTVDRQVPDSAGTATAYLCGIKTNSGTLGVGSEVQRGNCSASLMPEYQASSILKWAQEANKHTGIVTTTRVTHATPAATYAHSADRDWEIDYMLGAASKEGCQDIADQLVNGNTGQNIRVILGGGRGPLHPGYRSDGRNLTQEWMQDKESRGATAQYVTDATDLASIDTETTDFLLGLFSDSHMSYEIERTEEEPSLANMTLKAIEMLSKNKDGFFLLVEGGRIDHGLHGNLPEKSLGDLVAFDESVTAALKELDLEETLLIVTADHSHVMTLNGYPARGEDILGVAGIDNNGSPYNTLLFTNGPGDNITVPLRYETHGGEDVAIYAAGPQSHLFHHLHEQNYVAHVMAFAACVGPNPLQKCKNSKPKSDSVHNEGADLHNYSATPNAKQNNLPVISKHLQLHLDYQRDQLISQLGSEVLPRVAPYNDNDNHVH